MKTFDLASDNYLGETVDMTHKIVHVFQDGGMIYAVYRLGEDDQYVASKEVAKIRADPDAYLFTPYIMFVDLN